MRSIAAMLLVVSGCAGSGPPQGRTPYAVGPGMLAVLEEYQAMRARPLAGLSPARAREVPTLVEASRAIPNVKGLPAGQVEVAQVRDVVASGATGALAARLYRPVLARDTPTIVFFPGGTWVTGSLDQGDEAARTLSERTGSVVVSIRTRLAGDEAGQFPAAHDDAFAAYQWARGQMRSWGADPSRVALAGDGPGANLALSTALLARDRGVPVPDHLVLVTPWAGTGLNTVSMAESGDSRPLTRATVRWAQDLYAPDRAMRRDPRIDLVLRGDLRGLPPSTIVVAEIDPERSGGEVLAARLAEAGPLTPGSAGVGTAAPVRTEARVFPGVVQGFFGLGRTVPEAAVAEAFVADRLRAAFVRVDLPVVQGPVRPTPGRLRTQGGGSTR